MKPRLLAAVLLSVFNGILYVACSDAPNTARDGVAGDSGYRFRVP